MKSLRDNTKAKPLATKEPATIVLIGCSKSKLNRQATARELYTGQLFKKAVDWAERHGYQWFVISALHGLVTPNQTIAPYDYSLKDRRGSRERESWAHQTIHGQLTTHVSKASHAILIMPELYRRYIQPELDRQSITYTNPLQRLAMGKQMRWLDSN
jgi:hypothetical protein